MEGAITLAVYAASYAWVIRSPLDSRYAFAVHAALWMAALQLFGYYDPAVSRHAYEWFTFCAKAVATCIDCAIALGILTRLSRATSLELATLFLILCHQRVKLDWMWAADLFRLPVGVDAYLSTLAFSSNLACSVAFICILYQGELHAQEEVPR